MLADRVTRELRQGGVVFTATSTTITFRTYVRRTTCGGNVVSAAAVPATRCRVNYSCAGGICTRTVFSYYPSAADPGYVTVRFALPAEDGEDAITVEDGTALRNASL